MPLTFGLGEPVQLTALPVATQAQYALVQLLDAFYTAGDYKPVTRFNSDQTVNNVGLVPINQDGFSLKSKIDTEVALLTAPVRSEQALADFQILKEAGYHLRIEKISLDEWCIAIDHRLGTLNCCFIDA